MCINMALTAGVGDVLKETKGVSSSLVRGQGVSDVFFQEKAL